LLAVLELTADRQMRCSAATRRPFTATVRLVDDALVAGDYYDGAHLDGAGPDGAGPDGAGPDGGEPIAAFAWPMLLQAGGLARLAGARLELTPRGEAVLARPSYQGLGALWDRWLKSVSTDELARIEAIRGQRKPGTLTVAARRRAAVAAGLAAVKPGAWIEVDALFAILRAQSAPLVVARNSLALWRLYLGDPHYGSLGHAGRNAWYVLEARYALCALFEYAATLGVVDVAYTGPRGARDDYRELWGADLYASLSRYDGLAAVRVNEFGAAILHDPGALTRLGLPVPRRGPR
ncbi:MAG: hypothetical protein ACRDNT_12270, partial [Streptosporangiaceae bacterium]